jgi:nicotinate-nucleotide pyrophosphorylase (carboxylating)
MIPVPSHQMIRDAVIAALAEDLGAGDITTEALFPAPVRATGTITSEEPEDIVAAGLTIAREVFAQVDPALECHLLVRDGDRIPPHRPLLRLIGDGRSMLAGERVALNFLQRLSGIATLTAKFCERVKGFPVKILATRKTTPGFRALEKWAVRAGGGHNHRQKLDDGVLIKDNHLALAGGDVAAACRQARAQGPPGRRIEVEAETLDQVQAALEGGADIVLLDNMSLDAIRKAVELVKGRALVEVSGGVTLETIGAIAAAGPDLISIGALTHSARAVNLSMDIRPVTECSMD